MHYNIINLYGTFAYDMKGNKYYDLMRYHIRVHHGVLLGHAYAKLILVKLKYQVSRFEIRLL